MENNEALEIAQKLQKDIELWHIDQSNQIAELKKLCEEILAGFNYLNGKPTK